MDYFLRTHPFALSHMFGREKTGWPENSLKAFTFHMLSEDAVPPLPALFFLLANRLFVVRFKKTWGDVKKVLTVSEKKGEEKRPVPLLQQTYPIHI